jgi:nucleoid-associated protein YgaU
MGLISFLKNAGAKLFKSEVAREQEKADAIMAHIQSFNFAVRNLTVSVDDEKAIVGGEVYKLEDKNKILVTAGNVEGISSVEDKLWLNLPPEIKPIPVEPEKQFYTVKKGDYLSKIAKEVYGNANKYPVIFEANKPMLKDPDLIYPGQVLVIPPLES